MQNFFSLVLLTLLFLIACKGKTDYMQQPLSYVDTSKAFKREIPTFDDGRLDLFYVLTKEKQKQLGLDSMENGFENLQIRLWYDSSRARGRERKLLVLINHDTTWTAKLYSMQLAWDGDYIVSNKVRQIAPKSGWPFFIKRLLEFQVVTLPNMHGIPGLEDNWKDGESYHIEVATKMQYRFYSYHLPEEFQDQYWQAKNMVNILKLFTEEFAVRD